MPRRLRYDTVPFGLGHTKPRHFRDMLRVAWRNRDNLGYAWRVLTQGVCDGCALGTSGLRDWTIDGIHLCMVRLELLRLNTMGPLDHRRLEDVEELSRLDGRRLRELGRLAYPMRRRRGERGFRRVSFEEAFAEIGERWRAADPKRTAMYLTSRGLTNETYYVAQKVMRFLGSNSIDNSARLCHSPSTVGLKSTLGVGATTCSYRDWFAADLVVFFGSNPANDQPVTTKYLLEAKRRGVRVAVVNAYREPGLERYWVPSDWESALFGTPLADRFVGVRVGGDLAFLCLVQKRLVERGAFDSDFVAAHTKGFEDWREALAEMDAEELLAASGARPEDVDAFVEEAARARKAVLVWSMGITQHAHGADTVRAICDLALLRGWVGREGCGLMPIRGHSGVQGGAEMGAYATVFPGGVPIGEESARRFSELWGFEVPSWPGLTTGRMLEEARAGRIDALWCSGGNFLETMPQPDLVREALARIPLRIHCDIVLSSQMFVEPAEVCFLLPARTRYEQEGGGTETTTERRVIFSPEIPGHVVGEARTEWRLLLDLARAVRPGEFDKVEFADARAIREEIARAVPSYGGIERLEKKGDQFQWGGERLCEGGNFPTEDGRARFAVVRPPEERPLGPEEFLLATRRGKQFNSMVQADVDPLTGARRDHVFVSPEDAARLGLEREDEVLIVSAHGEMRARVLPAPVTPGTVQAHWPEANVLLPPDRFDPEGGVPDYNVRVRIVRAGEGTGEAARGGRNAAAGSVPADAQP